MRPAENEYLFVCGGESGYFAGSVVGWNGTGYQRRRHRVNTHRRWISAFVGMWLVGQMAWGAETPMARERTELQLSLVPPIQLVNSEYDVMGLRLGLFSMNHNVTGLDLGLVNWTSGDELALQWGVLNKTTGRFAGAQFGFVSLAGNGFVGWQASVVNVDSGKSVGFFNGAVNASLESGVGFQLGMFNYSREFTGLQFGLVNYTQTLTGLQIGLLNFITSKETLPVLPIVNASF